MFNYIRVINWKVQAWKEVKQRSVNNHMACCSQVERSPKIKSTKLVKVAPYHLGCTYLFQTSTACLLLGSCKPLAISSIMSAFQEGEMNGEQTFVQSKCVKKKKSLSLYLVIYAYISLARIYHRAIPSCKGSWKI